MKIADTAQARRLVQPSKPQPSKTPIADPISEHGQWTPQAPNATLTPTNVKPPVKAAPPPKPPAAASSSPEPMSFQDFLSSMGLTTPTPPSQDAINQMIQQALQPYMDAYNQQVSQITQQNQTQQTFENTLAQQLGTFLQGIGDTNYTPTMAALLGQGAERDTNYSNYQNQLGLWNSMVGGNNGMLAQIPQIQQQIEQQYQGPSSSDLLSAFNAYNGWQQQQFTQQHTLATDAYNREQAAAKAASDAATTRAAIWRAYEGSYVTDPQTAAMLGVKPGTFIPAKSSPPKTPSGQGVIDNTASANLGYLVDRRGNPILRDGKPVAVSGHGKSGGAGVVSPSLSAQVGVAVDGHGNPVLVGGRTVPWTTKKASAAKTSKAPSATQINRMVDTWKRGTTVSRTVTLPHTDANGNPVTRTVRTKSGQLSYQQAYRRLRTMGVPDRQARSYLDTAYRRGEQGRAWLTNEEQQALRKQGVQASAFRYRPSGGKPVAYLNPTQAAALKRAGVALPPGRWVEGRTNVQDLGAIYLIAKAF